jgi:hypothetical protein
MRIAAISAAAMAAVCFALAPAYGAQKGKSGGPSTHGAGAHGRPAAQTTHGNPHASAPNTAPPKTHGNPHTTSTTTKTTSGTTTAAVNPIARKLQGKPLGDRIEKMLPAGMTLDTASAGFKNQGQFIAAVHVSKNLGIPFADLKAAMLGTPTTATSTTNTSTSTTPMSLGQAIQRLKPSANSTAEAMLAEKQTGDDLRATSKTSKSKKTAGK